jgi:PKD repeat protein
MIIAIIGDFTASGGGTGLAPIASFTASEEAVPTYSTVNFTDTSTQLPTEWEWYRDGVLFATAQNASYSFTFPGIYEIKLIARNINGDDEAILLIEVYS